MGFGLTSSLVGAALASGTVVLLLVWRRFPAPVALPIAVLRVAIPVVYFAWFYDGRWTFLDDVTYVEQGAHLLYAGYDPFTVFFRKDGLILLFSLAQGVHILYGWWNHLAQFLFGPYYYSAIFLNVILSVVVAEILYRFAALAGFSPQYARGLHLFALLHWDILSWVSFINLKDVAVLTLSLTTLYLSVRALDTSRSDRVRSLAGVGGVLFTLLWIRFYMPVLILAALGLWVLLRQAGWRKYAVVGGAALMALLLVPTHLIPSGWIQLSPAAMVFGLVRFALTPQPWAIEPAYAFLLLPSMLHWLFFLPSLAGGVLLWRRSRATALLLLYLAVVVLFYAVVPELQGPRQRLQVAFALIWMQFHALYIAALRIAPRISPPAWSGNPVLPGTPA